MRTKANEYIVGFLVLNNEYINLVGAQGSCLRYFDMVTCL
ncbi:MAG: hypothetical protein ACI92O_001857 [Colwellia sp.]|jgi:hypothetical protein